MSPAISMNGLNGIVTMSAQSILRAVLIASRTPAPNAVGSLFAALAVRWNRDPPPRSTQLIVVCYATTSSMASRGKPASVFRVLLVASWKSSSVPAVRYEYINVVQNGLMYACMGNMKQSKV